MEEKEVLELFLESIDEVLGMSIGEFIEKYNEVLPRFDIVGEDEPLNTVIEKMIRGKDYIIVVDSRNRVKNMITYIDLLKYLGMKQERILSTALSSVHGTLRRSKIPGEVFKNIRVTVLSTPLPPHVTVKHNAREALHIMESMDTTYVAVVGDKNKAVAVITLHAIFRAIIKELHRRIKEKTSQ